MGFQTVHQLLDVLCASMVLERAKTSSLGRGARPLIIRFKFHSSKDFSTGALESGG